MWLTLQVICSSSWISYGCRWIMSCFSVFTRWNIHWKQDQWESLKQRAPRWKSFLRRRSLSLEGFFALINFIISFWCWVVMQCNFESGSACVCVCVCAFIPFTFFRGCVRWWPLVGNNKFCSILGSFASCQPIPFRFAVVDAYAGIIWRKWSSSLWATDTWRFR